VRLGVPKEVAEHVKLLESLGDIVHYPPRDNDQSDPVGDKICSQMAEALQEADEVHLWYNADSQGVHFDLGMAFLLNKPVKILNPVAIPTGTKSYYNVAKSLSRDNTFCPMMDEINREC
jgi:hypothetical protein